MMTSGGDENSAAANLVDGSDEATDSEELGVVDRDRRCASNLGFAAESRRMFQKLWTDADEIKVLEGFYEFTSRRGTTHANYQHDTGPFFDDIRPKLHFGFNKNQIVEKLRRLKKKYRNAATRIGSGRGSSVFKSPHDRATYEISRKIWSSTFKRKPKNQPNSDQILQALVPVAVVESSAPVTHSIPITVSSVSPPSPPPPPQMLDTKTEQIVEADALRICLATLFKELLHFALDGITTGRNYSVGSPDALGVMLLSSAKTGKEDVRLRWQRILELELYLKRLELLEETVRSALDKLKSSGT